MAAKKSHKQMDKTSASVARWLDDLRERQKKRQARARHGSTKPPRGGFRS